MLIIIRNSICISAVVIVEFASSKVSVIETTGMVAVCIIKSHEIATPLNVDIQAIDLTASGMNMFSTRRLLSSVSFIH